MWVWPITDPWEILGSLLGLWLMVAWAEWQQRRTKKNERDTKKQPDEQE